MNDPTNKSDKNNAFPSEYAHISDIMSDAEERIKQIDDQIKNIPPDRGPSLQYNPPGFIGTRQTGSRDQLVASLEKAKSQIKIDTLNKIEQETTKADPKIAKDICDNVRGRLYKNPYEGLDADKMQATKSQRKDIEASQNYMDAQLKDRVASSRTENKTDVTKKSNVEPVQEEKRFPSFSARFSQSLNYTQAVEKADSSPEKTGPSPEPNPTPQKGHIDIDRD